MLLFLSLFVTANAYVVLDKLTTEIDSVETDGVVPDVAALIKKLPIVDHLMNALAAVHEEDPELMELIFHPPHLNMTMSMRERIRHYTGEEPEVRGNKVSYTIIPQVDQSGGSKVGYIKIPRDSGSPSDKDKVCADACTKAGNCEYWIRQTNGEGCWLEKGYYGVSGMSIYRRLGISGNNGAKCSLAKVVAKRVNKWLADNTLDDPSPQPQFQEMHLHVPTDFDCIVADHPATKTFVLNFRKLDFKVHTYFDAGGMNGNATVFMRLATDAALDYNKWKPKRTRGDVVQAHVGLMTVAPGPISHWVSGASYAAMKSDDTCDTLIAAYAANWINGKSIKKITLKGMEQPEANNACCHACKDDKDCDGFQVDRTDHTKNKNCNLMKPYKDQGGRHFNFKGQKKTLKDNVGSMGTRVGYIDLPGNGKYTQEQLDEMCAKGCNEAPECQMWMTTTTNVKSPQCWLQRAYKLDNGMVQGILVGQVQGQLNDGLREGMKALMSAMEKKCAAGKC